MAQNSHSANVRIAIYGNQVLFIRSKYPILLLTQAEINGAFHALKQPGCFGAASAP